VNTVAVGAQWFTSAKEDDDLIYSITKALWNNESRKLLDVGHAKGKTITPASALNGVGVPLHAGAERFYKEAGLIGGKAEIMEEIKAIEAKIEKLRGMLK